MKKRAIWLCGVVLVFAAGMAIGAQGVIVTPNGGPVAERVLSGDDIGFMVESEGRDGALKGRFVVKEDGKWKDIVLSPRIRIVR